MSKEKIHRPKLFSNLKYDFAASMVVFFVAVPLCLGIALASGAPLFSGLIAGIIGGIVVGALSNSPIGVSGPAAGLAVIVLTAIENLGSFQIFLLAVVISGVLQIILGLLKSGVIGYYFPSSVIKGMLSGIGIIIILKQIPHAFGYDVDYEGDMAFIQADGGNTFTTLIKMLDYITPGAVVVTILSLSILFLWEIYMVKKHTLFTLIQGPLVAVVLGILYQLAAIQFFPEFALGIKQLVMVPVAKDFAGFFGQFSFPDFTQILNKDVWIIAFTLAIVASLETLLSVEAADNLDPYKRVTSKNRELYAQGTGNIISGLVGGLPITQVILRSSVNVQSGGKTKLSTIFHGFLLLICIVIIPHILNMVPLAVLASILFVVGYKLAKPALFSQMYKMGWSQFLPFIVTIAGVVFTDLLKGIMMGMAIAVVTILRNSLKNSHFLHKEEEVNGYNKVKMTLAEEVTFLNKGAILKELDNLPSGTHLTIDISKSCSIEYDVIENINNFKKIAPTRNIKVDIISRPVMSEVAGKKRENISESDQALIYANN